MTQPELLERIDRLESDVRRGRRRERWWSAALLIALGGWLFGPSVADAERARRELRLQSDDGQRQAHFTADGFSFERGGKARVKLEIGESWDYLSFFNAEGNIAWTVATEPTGTAMKIFSAEEKLRLEVSENLIDSGAGIRLYDKQGNPRATLYSDKRGGETGLELTDANRQPRVDIYAEPNGVTVIRASTSQADSSAELSILPESDALFRYTGVVPEHEESDPFVPMLYMFDRTGTNTLVTPVKPR